ncbi:MAG: CPBP family intramembrane metalloprotease [Saccharofermentans sp.]|nr:CPBP family intramembrane metalloprotease [Saccharofermentans sp.]
MSYIEEGNIEDVKISFARKALGIVTALLKCAAGVVILVGTEFLVMVVMYMCGLDPDIYNGVYSAVSSVIGIVFLYLFSLVEGTIVNKKKSHLIRFNKPDPKSFLYAVVIGFALLGIVQVYLIAASLISEYFEPVNEAVQEYSESMDVYKEEIVYPFWDKILYIVAIVFMVPIAEEFAFRGIMYGAVNRRLNAAWAVGISAAIFGLLHGISIHIGYALISGFIIGAAYYVFDNIFVTAVIHGVFNLFGSAIYYIAELFGISEERVPSMFLVKFAMFLPAALILAQGITARRRTKNEQA